MKQTNLHDNKKHTTKKTQTENNKKQNKQTNIKWGRKQITTNNNNK